MLISTYGVAQSDTEKQEKETKILRKLAVEKAIELQKELNLSLNASNAIQKIIFDYSAKANRVLQSNVSTQEKSKNISNLVYFQNEELKKILSVDQFYKYMSMQNVYVADF